jgi:hypothetical protein
VNASTVLLPDTEALNDLRTFVGRARRADPEGAVRLVGHGSVLAVFVSPLHGSGGPTVLGMRTTALARPSRVDVTMSMAMMDGILGGAAEGAALSLSVLVGDVVDVPWAGISPPRSGWEVLGQINSDVLARAARAGEAEVASGTPAASGAQALRRLRARVWSRSLTDDPTGLPSGIAFVAHVLGFIVEGELCTAYRTGAWSRVTTCRGHVLARTGSLL